MAAKGMYDTIKQAIQDLIAPDLERIKGQLTGVDARISALEKRVDEGFRAVRDRIDALKDRVAETNKRLDEALDIRECLATLEAKFAARS